LTVEYDGKKWTRAKNGYYQITNKNHIGKNWLHQYVYEKEKGPIKQGYEIHHKDKNKDNNSISNLEMLLPEEHAKNHAGYKYSNPERYKKQCEHLDRIRPDHVWPEDPVKYEQHRKALKKAMQNIKPVMYRCVNCGNEFKNTPNGVNKFCSNKCKSAYRRKNGLDNIKRICVICGKEFIINKYTKTTTCNRSCANVLRARTIRNAISRN